VSGAPANIFEQQAANRRNTVLVMVLFVLFVGFLGFGFDVYFLGFTAGGRGLFGFPIATFAALLLGGFSAYSGLEGGARSVLSSSGAVPAPPDDPRYRQLHNVVEEIAIAAGLPKPQVYVIPDPDPNAFATGKDPDHACIAVTQGLLDSLSREELQGVIAHEMGHVRNFDIRLMTVIAALIGAVMLLVEFGSRSMQFGRMGWGGGAGPPGRGGGGGGGGPSHLLGDRHDPRAVHLPAPCDGGIAAARVPRGRIGGRADAQPYGTGLRASENRRRGGAHEVDQEGNRPPVHRQPAGEQP